MVVQIKEFNQGICEQFELDLEPQAFVSFQAFTHLRTSTCLTPNKVHHKLRRLLW